ncbi:Eukaryotic initiation factor 4A-III [Linnemannia exigua]|uniref:Eukaryotic initiation factor 4A-III n=1 Tax=Linnemannia exigua TaxID=604196 RepID=A0AAD4H2F0_9FUNG|nr:Eukaryotic initiation factor 4A-III [Linnemannia exigua]
MSEATASAPPAAVVAAATTSSSASSGTAPSGASTAAQSLASAKKQDDNNKNTQDTATTTKATSNKPREPKTDAGSLPGSPKSARSKKSNHAAGASRGQENGARSSSGTAGEGHANGSVGLGVSSSSVGGSGSNASHPNGAVEAAGSGDKERDTSLSSSQSNHQNNNHPKLLKDSKWPPGGGERPNNNTSSNNNHTHNNAPYNKHPRPNNNNNNSSSAPASTSEARFANSRPPGGGNYRSGGGGNEDDFAGRGRKFDKRTPRPHPGPLTEQPPAGTTPLPSQRLESPGVSEAKKSQNATRSPRSPRSPRRGFGERGASSVAAGAGEQQDKTTRTSEGQAEKKDGAAGSKTEVGAGAVGSAKKRKAVRKNDKTKDDDEGSTVSHGSAREGDSSSSLDLKEPSSAGNKDDSSSSSAPVREDSQTAGGSGGAASNSTWVPKSKSNRPQQPDHSGHNNHNNTRSPFKNNGPRDGNSNHSSNNYNRNDSSSTSSSYNSRNSYLGQRNGTDGRRPHHSDRGTGPRDTTTDSGGWASGKSRSIASGNKDGSRDQPPQDGWGSSPAATTQSGGVEDAPNWISSSSTAAQKDGSHAQDGWGAPPVPAPAGTQNTGWNATPTAAAATPSPAVAATTTTSAQSEGWDKAPAKKDVRETNDGWGNAPGTNDGWGKGPETNDGWGKAPETNDGWGKAPETNDGWGKAPETNDGWGKAPETSDSWSRTAKSEGWSKDSGKKDNRGRVKGEGWGPGFAKSERSNKSSAKSQGGGNPETPTTHHSDKREETPTTATTTTTQAGGRDQQSPARNDKRREDYPAKAQNAGGGKKDPLAPVAASASGWGEAPSTITQNDSWNVGQSANTGITWGESVPWETKAASAPVTTSGWGDTPGIARKQDSTASSHGDSDQKRTGVGRGKSLGSSDARFAASHQGHQRGGGPFQDNRGDRRFQDTDSSRQTQGSTSQPQQPLKDARPSLDTRNERLGIQRGPRPREDGRSDQRGEATEKPTGQLSRDSGNKDSDHEKRRAPAGDARLEPRAGGATRPGQRNGGNSNQFGQRDQANEFFQRKSPTNKGIYDKAGSGRANGKMPNIPNKQTPMFSNSLECQMTWEEMDLKPEVLAKIAKAGLEKPSNIQKLVMKPFKEGKDVIAQTQSQKDRTNTLAIALLEKLSSKAHTHKYPQAVVICSDGINPQRVNEDFQDWFEGVSGLGSIYLTSEDLGSEESVLSDQEQAKQVVVTTLGPLMEVLRKELVDMKFVETVVISMRADELVNFDAFKQFWVMLPREAQVVMMTGRIQPQIQMIKTQNFRPNTAVRRADELTMQWSEHYFVDIPRQTVPPVTDGEGDETGETKDHKWEVLMQILGKNPDISHVVILTQSQSLTQALTAKLEQQNLPVLSVWSMADKTEVARQFNQPERCILVSESLLMDSLDLNHSSLVINYEMPKRASHYISSFGPFGRSGLRTLMINFCVKEDPVQLLSLECMEAMYDIKVREMQLD